MPRFGRYDRRPPGFKYPEPERYTPAVARARRLQSLLAVDPRFAEIRNFSDRLVALSQVTENKKVAPVRKAVNDQVLIGHKAALIAAALSKFKEGDFSDPRKRAAYRELRRQQEALRASSSRRVQRNVPGADKRFFNPTGKSFASRVNGAIAGYTIAPHSWVQVFANPGSVIPCVQRSIRRQVLFAKGKGGKGYRGPKRRTWMSGVPC